MEITKKYAEVVLPLPIDRIWHYLIPPELWEEAEAGKRVLVPFGSRLLTGYLIGFVDKAPVAEVKEVLLILDREPLLDAHLLAVTRWISEYYLCPWGEVIKAALPSGLEAFTELMAVPLLPDQESFSGPQTPDPRPQTPIEAEFLELLIKKGSLPFKTIQNKLGRVSTTLLGDLARKGFIALKADLKLPQVKPRLETTLHLALEGDDLIQALSFLKDKAPKQAEVISALERSGGTINLRELRRLTGASRSSIQGLIRKGFLFSRQEPLPPAFPGDVMSGEIPPELTPLQREVLRPINEALSLPCFKSFLLHGVTGSGKTEVYLRAIEATLKLGRKALVLVPEIGLTPQLAARFQSRFGPGVAVIHSGLSARERFLEWLRVRERKAPITIGTRSAVFAPIEPLGLIIVDEEQEGSYKQEETPRYHARDVALKRAQMLGIPIILGSATPSLESYWRAQIGEYTLLSLPERVERRPLPITHMVDMKVEPRQENRPPIFSRKLTELIKERLGKGEQVLLFLNRRGFSTLLLCRNCGFSFRCGSCSVSLTYHAQSKRLMCHYCHSRRKVSDVCPGCGGASLVLLGLGTQQAEAATRALFPKARVARMDRDTTAGRGSHERILTRLQTGEIEILVGTQMIGKGHDFPGVTLVGVVSADHSLNLPDFRAAERTFCLLAQVVGRAGRGDLPGEAVIQTYNPHHYCLIAAQSQDYLTFFQRELPLRQEANLPPFTQLVLLLLSGPQERQVQQASEELRCLLKPSTNLGIIVDGPAPAPVYKLKGRFRWQLLAKGEDGDSLRAHIKEAVKDYIRSPLSKGISLSIDVDPL